MYFHCSKADWIFLIPPKAWLDLYFHGKEPSLISSHKIINGHSLKKKKTVHRSDKK